MTIIGAVIAGLAALLAIALRLFLGERGKRQKAEGERDAQVAARRDDVGRLEDVVAAGEAQAQAEREKVPTDIGAIRDAIRKQGGVPLPDRIHYPVKRDDEKKP